MNIRKTIIVTVLALATVALVNPVPASAITVEELLAQIAILNSQLLALQGGTGTTGTVPAACAGVTFTRNLTVGSTGTDVKCLQVLLNGNGYKIAATGAGSPGMETTYFGSLTLNAVKAFQTAKGWIPVNQVGPATRAALNTMLTSGTTTTTTTTTTTPTGGVEGSITVTKAADPASGVELYTGQSNVPVTSVNVKATGSDVLLNRLDLTFNAIAGASCNVRPWTNISSVTVSDGTTSKTASVTSSSAIENTVGSSYTVRVDGLGILVSKDTTKKVTVSVTGASSLPVGATSCTVTNQFAINAVRGTDGAGVSQYGPVAALTATTFIVKSSDTGTLEVSVDGDNPKARNVLVDETNTTQGVVLMRVNVKAKSNDVILRTVRINAVSSDTLATVMPTVRLYDGDTNLASTSTAASSTFDDLNLTIPKGTTKTLIVKGDLAKTTGNYSEGTYVQATLTATDITGEDATSYSTVTGAGSNLAGERAYAYLKAPTFALASASIVNVPGTSGSSSQAADATIRVNVTANGGDIFVRKVSATAASSGIVTQTQNSATGTVAYSYTTNATAGANNTWKISAGQTVYFDVVTRVTNEADFYNTYPVGVEVLDVKWAITDVDVDGSFTTQTWGVDTLETGTVFLSPRG
jgi:hypothetical protein